MIKNSINFFKNKYSSFIENGNFSEIMTGSALALGGRVFATGLSLIANIVVARYYGAEVVGIVAVVNSFLMLATIFTLLGTNTSIMRLIPEYMVKYSASSARQVYRKSQFIVVVASFFFGIIFFFNSDIIATKIFSKQHLSFYFCLASIFIIFKSLTLFNTQAVRGLKLIKVFACMQVLPQAGNLLFLLLLGLIIPSNDVPIYSLFGCLIMTGVVGSFIMEISFRRITHRGDLVKSIPTATILMISLPMFMTGAINIVSGQVGIIMIGILGSESDVGVFSVAVKLATLTGFILKAINTIAAPKFSELYHSFNIDELFIVVKKTAKLIFWTTTPILISLIILGKYLLLVLFGHDFVLAYPALVFLILGQFVNSVSGCTGIFMNMAGHQKAFRNIIFVGSVVFVILNVTLIPRYGINGAAFSVLLNECIWNVSTLIFIKLNYGKTTGYFPLVG
ncbi:flippase [Desulfatiferula olefinivorans]